MAYVARSPDAGDDGGRGQLILVTGLMIAVAMVALVLLLNTAIYTENLASRGADQSAREAIEYRGTLVEGVGGLVEAENGREYDAWNPLQENVSAGIHGMDNHTARSQALRGRAVEVNGSSISLKEGRLIRQTDVTRQFTNASGGKTDWQLASGISKTRDYRLRVNTADLETTTTDAFHVHLEETGGGAVWEAFIYRKNPSEVAVATGTGAGATERCTATGSTVTVDLTRGTLGGEPCDGLVWAVGLSGSYDVGYRNAENVTGTYNLTVEGTTASLETENFNDVGPSPYHVPAVYDASFEVSYRSPELTYRSTVRVAPGEPE